jgi:hypothetical protein
MEAPYPNNLKTLAKNAGWTIRELHLETGIPRGTLYYWNRGGGVIAAEYREKLARIIGCTPQDLAPLNDVRNGATNGRIAVSRMKATELSKEFRESLPQFEESDGCFSFGKIKTTAIVLDGDGMNAYQPQHIRSHYIPMTLELPEEIAMRKEQIAQEQEERKAQGDSYQWNGERYNLVKFNIGRDPQNEDMSLGLWFRPSDYYTFLATSAIAQDQEIRKRYLADVEWDEAVPLFAHSFSVLLAVVTCDGQTILVQRGRGLGCRPNVFDVGLAEGLSRPIDCDSTSQAPDVYRCAIRGLTEELGLHEPADFSASDLLFLSFAVDTEFCMWGLFGMVKLKRGTEEVLENLRRSARDRFEHRRVFSVPFTPEGVCSFVFSHEPFSPGGLVCLYYTLVHEFGREEVDRIISSH